MSDFKLLSSAAMLSLISGLGCSGFVCTCSAVPQESAPSLGSSKLALACAAAHERRPPGRAQSLQGTVPTPLLTVLGAPGRVLAPSPVNLLTGSYSLRKIQTNQKRTREEIQLPFEFIAG